MKVTIYAQIEDNAIHPVGQAESDDKKQLDRDLAAVLFEMAEERDPGAALLHRLMRADEEIEEDNAG